ncbi:plastocyanin/azurin family copper-binding protein [Halomontanus rarus]|uniref:plastocyanin/azurin family copper-binding protein n=1 Tax=Halomontanus rarus TaxID=3034020 RepID=UPI001A98703A
MNRREFMVAASGVSGVAAVATATIPVGAQDNDSADDPGSDTAEGNGNGGAENGTAAEGDGEDGNATAADGGGGGGGTETVEVVDNEFLPDSLTIQPGTTVEFAWQSTSADHNVNPTSQPEGANWEGHTDLESGDFSFESTFDTEGDYEYQCDPHVGLGMTGTITVSADAGGAAEADVDIHDIGVPLQKHFLGIATLLAIFVSLVFTFYVLKYGESAHSSSPGRR